MAAHTAQQGQQGRIKRSGPILFGTILACGKKWPLVIFLFYLAILS
jgi:hypothetical protein